MKGINKVITSREEIIAKCIEMTARKGGADVNIRNVAKECNVSVGSIYYYFSSKTELVCAVIEEIWKDIFNMDSPISFNSFYDCVEWIFTSVKQGFRKYPNFFLTHSMSFAKDEKGQGRSVMERCFSHIKSGLEIALQNDKNVRNNAFTEDFTEDKFVSFVFTSLLTLLSEKESSCDVLIEMIRRTIY